MNTLMTKMMHSTKHFSNNYLIYDNIILYEKLVIITPDLFHPFNVPPALQKY